MWITTSITLTNFNQGDILMHEQENDLWASKLLNRHGRTWEGRAMDFAFLYSLTAKSYSPLLMLPRIVLGKLNSVRNLCSIPWTDLIFSASAYNHSKSWWNLYHPSWINRNKPPTKSKIQVWLTCLSNRCWNARLANELTPSIQLNKWEVPEPSGSSSIRFNFDSISAKESISSTSKIKKHQKPMGDVMLFYHQLWFCKRQNSQNCLWPIVFFAEYAL